MGQTGRGAPACDYTHVVDLARGHLAALTAAGSRPAERTFRAYSLGTGKGSTVAQVVSSIEKAAERLIPESQCGRAGAGSEMWHSAWRLPLVRKKSLEDAAVDGQVRQRFAAAHSPLHSGHCHAMRWLHVALAEVPPVISRKRVGVLVTKESSDDCLSITLRRSVTLIL